MRILKISIAKVLFLLAAMLMLNGNTLFAQVDVTLPTVYRAAGSPDDCIPITVGSLTGKNVTAFEFAVFYDKNIVYITGASVDGTIAGGSTVFFNADTANGIIRVAWASASPLADAGVLVKLNVKYRKVGTTDLTFINPADSKNTFLFNAGNPAANTNNGKICIPSISVRFDPVNTWVCDTICIPISTSELTSANNILSYDFTASYDPSVIKIIGCQTQGTLSEGGTTSMNTEPAGTIKYAWARSTKITGHGVLLYLRAVALKKGAANLALLTFQYNAGNPVVWPVPGGDVIVTDTNRKPVITVRIPENKVITSDDSLGTKTPTFTFQFKASDPDVNSTLRFTAVRIPEHATLDQAGNFSWKPTAYQIGKTHTIIISVTDGIDVVKDTSYIKVDRMTDVENGNVIPEVYSLRQNYPNPFNPTTKIVYELPQASKVRLSVFSLLGQEVAVLVNEFKAAGKHSVNFNAANMTSGMYIYRLETPDYISVKKMTLVK